MKKLFILSLALVSTTSLVQAQKMQEKQVPQQVKAELQKQFPKATSVKWEKENGEYEAGFLMGKTEHSALFSASGSLLETEVEMETEALPSSVNAYISKNYANKKIKEAAKIMDAHGIVTYEAEVDGKDILFNSKGDFLKINND